MRKKITKELITDAALELLDQKGIEEVTIKKYSHAARH